MVILETRDLLTIDCITGNDDGLCIGALPSASGRIFKEAVKIEIKFCYSKSAKKLK